MVFVCVAVACLGMPHGATDHLVGDFGDQGPLWIIPFSATYLGMTGLVWLVWLAFPSLSLAAFLAMSIVHWGLGDAEEDLVPRALLPLEVLTPESIKFNRFLKLIPLEHKPLLACFGFVTRQKWLVSRKINLRKRLNLIDSGVKVPPSAPKPRVE